MNEIKKIEEALKSDDPEIIIQALIVATMNSPKIEVKLIFQLMDHEVQEVSIMAFQTLGVYGNVFYKEIAEEIKKCADNPMKQNMLITALAINPMLHNVQFFTDLITDEDEELKLISANILAFYGQISIIPLIAKIDTAGERDLQIIKSIFETIGKRKVLGVLKGFPLLPIMDNLLKVFDDEDLKEIQNAGKRPPR